MSIINRFLEANRNKCLWVYCIGDAMVDSYYSAKVNRISPEFPMPIVLVKERNSTFRPGGVANVAYQMRHFNTHTQLLTICDQLGSQVFRDHKLNLDHSTLMAFSQLPVKQRFLDNDTQVIRIDFEDQDFYLSKNDLQNAVQHLADVVHRPAKPDVVIFSDYNKGLFYDPQMFIKPLRETITIVDPKKGPIQKWYGCTIFKPNAAEAKELSGLSDWKEQCDFFKKELDCEAVIITQSGDGVVGLHGTEYFEYHPKERVDVASVIGAGDCFISILALAVGHGFTIPEASEIAFEAGKVYVQNKMNRPIVPAELSQDRIVHPKDLVNRDFKLVLTNGCYDIIHPGHVHLIHEAAKYGEKLVVALNSDESIRRLKGESRPINSLEDRLAVISALKDVDFVTVFEEDTPLRLIKDCKPDVLVKGNDYEISNIVGADITPEVYTIPLLDGRSTTKIIESLGF